MKKSSIKLIGMVVALAALVGAFFWLKHYNANEAQKAAEEEAEAAEVFLDVATDDILAFSYVLNEETLSFTKDGENWLFDGDPSLDLDESTITTMLGNLSAVEASQKLEGISDFSEYGFDEPHNVITYTTAEGTHTITVGKYNGTLYLYYVKTDTTGDCLYMLSGGLTTSFNKDIDSLVAVEEEESTEETVEESTEETVEASTDETVEASTEEAAKESTEEATAEDTTETVTETVTE